MSDLSPVRQSVGERLELFQKRARTQPMAISIHAREPEKPGTKGLIRTLIVGAALIASAVAYHDSKPSANDEPAGKQEASGLIQKADVADLFDVRQKEVENVPALNELAKNLNFVNVNFAGKDAYTLDVKSRILLSKAAAKEAGLDEVGLDWRDVYGLIHAETSWVGRKGKGLNKVKSHGLAQFEPGTAKAVGLKNPNDPVESVVASAKLMKTAAMWTQERIDEMNVKVHHSDDVIRQGVSVFYNLSWKARHAWHPQRADSIPQITHAHMLNTRIGARLADQLNSDLKAGKEVVLPPPRLVVTLESEMKGLMERAQEQANRAKGLLMHKNDGQKKAAHQAPR